MSKFLQIVLVACLAVALCAAEAPRRAATRFQPAAPRRTRVLARQEEAPAAVTPYPSAAELKPEVAFDEVEQSAQAPAEDAAALPEHQPDQTYGPPEIETDEVPLAEEEQPAVEADVPAEAAEEAEGVEQTEAAAEEEEDAAAAAAAEEAQVQSERLIFARRNGARRSARPAKLRAAPKARAQEVPQFVAQPMFYYQSW